MASKAQQIHDNTLDSEHLESFDISPHEKKVDQENKQTYLGNTTKVSICDYVYSVFFTLLIPLKVTKIKSSI